MAARDHPTLTIDLGDLDRPSARLNARTLRGQFVDFYALLALMRTDSLRRQEWLTRERLHNMTTWHHKSLGSVGREVCNFINRNKSNEIMLEFAHKTRAWRLEIPPSRIRFVPARTAVADWIRNRTVKQLDDESWVDSLEVIVDAQIAVHRGDGDRALQILTSISDTSSPQPELDAWAGLLRARATDQFVDNADDYDALDELAAKWAKRDDAAGRSAAARIVARMALRKRVRDLDEQRRTLMKLAANLELGGDVSGLASVINVLGVLTSKVGEPRQATVQHLRAAALFGLCGDFNSLQAALFNLANCHARTEQNEGRAANDKSFRLLKLCSKICSVFYVGRDSALAELSGVNWALDVGDYSRARDFLEQALGIVERLDSSYEAGCFYLAQARLEQADPTGQVDVRKILRTAIKMFRKAGDEVAENEARRLLEGSEKSS